MESLTSQIACHDTPESDAGPIAKAEQDAGIRHSNLKTEKRALARLIQRRRNGSRQTDRLRARIDDLECRARSELDDGNEIRATEAAQAIASLENQIDARTRALVHVEGTIMRQKQSIDVIYRQSAGRHTGASQASSKPASTKTGMATECETARATSAEPTTRVELGTSGVMTAADVLARLSQQAA
jgi:phage shock protein A